MERCVFGRVPIEDIYPGAEAFLEALRGDIDLPQQETDLLVEDFRALLYRYADQGLEAQTAFARLGDRPLRGFYRRLTQPERYHNLFTDAFFPLSETAFNQNVWRSTVRLPEPVDPVVLQAALDMVLPDFPYFSTWLHHGFFWFDLYGMRRRLAVTPLRPRPGAPIRPGRYKPLFLAEYEADGIIVEGRHALVDGTGCVLFTRALTRTYLHLTGRDLPHPVKDHINCAARSFPNFQEVYGVPEHKNLPSSLIPTRALHLAGRPKLLQAAGYSAVALSAGELTALAHEKGVTVTTLLSSILFLCIRDCLPQKRRLRGRAKLAVPVNLHKFYPLDTLRNYSMFINIELDREELTTLEALLPKVADQLTRQNNPQVVGSMIGGVLQQMQRPLARYAPAFLKWLVMCFARLVLWEPWIMTSIFSNLGVIPDEFAGDIRSFGVAASAVKSIRRKVVLATTGDRALLTLTKTTDDMAFEQALLRRLAEAGLHGELTEP